MGATSVTGVGPGASNGEYKPENSSGCCNHRAPDPVEATPPLKKSCAVRVKTGGTVRYAAGNSNKIRVC